MVGKGRGGRERERLSGGGGNRNLPTASHVTGVAHGNPHSWSGRHSRKLSVFNFPQVRASSWYTVRKRTMEERERAGTVPAEKTLMVVTEATTKRLPPPFTRFVPAFPPI